MTTAHKIEKVASRKLHDSAKAVVIVDPAYTADALAQFQCAEAFAHYELAAAVKLCRAYGMTWQEVADGLNLGTKQAASQWLARNDPGHIDAEEQERLLKLLGIKARQVKFGAHVILSGRRGVTAIVTRPLSTHLTPAKAIAVAKKHGGRVEVRRIDPDGTETLIWEGEGA